MKRAPTSASAPEDYAIVVGVSRYPHRAIGDLKGPLQDASDFRDWLVQDAGLSEDRVRLVVTPEPWEKAIDPFDAPPTAAMIEREFNRLHALAATSPRLGRRLYLFFAGHGFRARVAATPWKEVALLCANAMPEALEHFAGKVFADALVERKLFDEVLLFMDCCRSPVQGVNLRLPVQAPQPGTRPIRVRCLYGFACQDEAAARERPDGTSVVRGVFTQALLDGLRNAANRNGEVTDRTLARYVEDRMRERLSPDERKSDRAPRPEFILDRVTERPFVIATIERSYKVNLDPGERAEGATREVVMTCPDHLALVRVTADVLFDAAAVSTPRLGLGGLASALPAGLHLVEVSAGEVSYRTRLLVPRKGDPAPDVRCTPVIPGDAERASVTPGALTRVDLDALQFTSAAPITPADAEHATLRASFSAAPHGVERGALFVCVRAREPLAPGTLTLHDHTGALVFDLGAAQDEVGASRVARLDRAPGALLLRYSPPGRSPCERSIFLHVGWQTGVFLASEPTASRVEVPTRLDFDGMALSLARMDGDLGAAFDRLRETELLRLHLASGTTAHPFADIPRAAGADPVGALLGGFLHVAAGGSRERVEATVRELRATLGRHPDVEALALAAGLETDHVFDHPPLLAESWRALMRNKPDEDRVPADSYAAKVGASLCGDGVWLTWLPSESPAESEPSLTFAECVKRLAEVGGQSEHGSTAPLAHHASLSVAERAILELLLRFQPEHADEGLLHRCAEALKVPVATTRAVARSLVAKVEGRFRYQVLMLGETEGETAQGFRDALSQFLHQNGMEDTVKLVSGDDWRARVSTRAPLVAARFGDGEDPDALLQESLQVYRAQVYTVSETSPSVSGEGLRYVVPELSSKEVLAAHGLIAKSDRRVALLEGGAVTEQLADELARRHFEVVRIELADVARMSPRESVYAAVLVDSPEVTQAPDVLGQALVELRHLGVGLLHLAWPGRAIPPETQLTEHVVLRESDFAGAHLRRPALERVGARVRSLFVRARAVHHQRSVPRRLRREERTPEGGPSPTGPVFLSAGVPTLDRLPHYAQTADVNAIAEAVRALVQVVLPHRRLVFGGHPVISSFVRAVAVEVDAARMVHIYQSRFFETDAPVDSLAFENLHWCDAQGGREESLEAMRKEMIGSERFAAGVFIGGMDGIEEEYAMFRVAHPEADAWPIASTGGAALCLFDRAWADSGDRRTRRRLVGDGDYVALFDDLLGE